MGFASDLWRIDIADDVGIVEESHVGWDLDELVAEQVGPRDRHALLSALSADQTRTTHAAIAAWPGKALGDLRDCYEWAHSLRAARPSRRDGSRAGQGAGVQSAEVDITRLVIDELHSGNQDAAQSSVEAVRNAACAMRLAQTGRFATPCIVFAYADRTSADRLALSDELPDGRPVPWIQLEEAPHGPSGRVPEYWRGDERGHYALEPTGVPELRRIFGLVARASKDQWSQVRRLFTATCLVSEPSQLCRETYCLLEYLHAQSRQPAEVDSPSSIEEWLATDLANAYRREEAFQHLSSMRTIRHALSHGKPTPQPLTGILPQLAQHAQDFARLCVLRYLERT